MWNCNASIISDCLNIFIKNIFLYYKISDSTGTIINISGTNNNSNLVLSSARSSINLTEMPAVVTKTTDTAIADTIYYLENDLSMTVTKTTTATDLSATNTSYYLLKMVATENGKLATNNEFTSAKDTSLAIVDVSGIPDRSYNHDSYGYAFWSPGIMKAQYLLPYQNKPDTVADFAWLLNTTLAKATNIGIKDPVIQVGYRSIQVRTVAQAIADNDVLYNLQ